MLRKADRCPSCRGKGRKLLLLRRSDARGGNASHIVDNYRQHVAANAVRLRG